MAKADLLLKKGQLADEARHLLETAERDNREELRKEEQEKFNAIHVDIEKISTQLKMIERQEEVERSMSDSGSRKTEPNALNDYHGSSRLKQGARDYHDAVRAWFLTGAKSAPDPIPGHLVQAAQRVGLDLHKNSLSFRLGQNGLRSTTARDMDWWQKQHDEERALSGPQTTTSVGGYSIQDAAMREVEVALLAYGAMRKVATIIRTDTGGPLPIPTVNDSTNVGALIAEGTTVSTQDFTFSQLVLDGWTYTSKAVLVSLQLMQDNSVNLPQLIGRLLGERLGRVTNTDYTTGSGTNKPNGVINAATFTQAATGNSTTITLANLIALYHAVDPAYRDNARWMMNDNTISKLKQLLDSQGRPLWFPGLIDGAPDTLMGSPYVINQAMSSMTSTGKSILFGDFSKYWIRDVRDFTLLRLDERYAEFLQVAFVAFMRTDGDLLDAGTHPIQGYQNATA